MVAQVQPRPVVFANRYTLVRRLATGGMAEIYLARQRASDGSGFEKDVVIKRLRPELVGDKRIAAMFRDEGRLGAFISHPNTVHIYDVGNDHGTPFIVMEYIRGEELSDLCRRGLSHGQFLPLEHSVWLIRQAALSLGHFHACCDDRESELRVVHCDISPTNLMVTHDGFVKVIDFGISQFRGQENRSDAAVPGKLSYMSPEQAKRQSLDHRSDIYSLGIVLYEITLGRRLYKGPANEVIQRLAHGTVKPPTFSNNDYPGALESIVMRALEPSPRDRYASAFDLADELQAFLAESSARIGPAWMARYLDELSVAAGGSRREELISESEDDGDGDELDFDRGRQGELGTSAMTAAAVAEWDEFEEDDQAVADALGIDVNLVRTQTRADVGSEPLDSSLGAGQVSDIASEAQERATENDAGRAQPHAPKLPQPPPGPPASEALLASALPSKPVVDVGSRQTLNPAASIRPLEQPRSLWPIALAAVIGGAVVFLILQFL